MQLLIYLKQARCLLEGGACLIEMMEERKREQQVEETWKGREPGLRRGRKLSRRLLAAG